MGRVIYSYPPSQLNTTARLALAFQKMIKNEIMGEGKKEKDEVLYMKLINSGLHINSLSDTFILMVA
ncbi:hypothetical protein OAM91_03840 [Gammaproteobacteria bacterium]|nr:hypothetical protein [Gammaproteobacteria bacterium]